jgi:hypothetical protein
MSKAKSVARKRTSKRARPLPPDVPPAGLSPAQFCRRYQISRSTFEAWRRAGCGPAELQPQGKGGHIRITEQAEREWLQRRTAFAAIADAQVPAE